MGIQKDTGEECLPKCRPWRCIWQSACLYCCGKSATTASVLFQSALRCWFGTISGRAIFFSNRTSEQCLHGLCFVISYRSYDLPLFVRLLIIIWLTSCLWMRFRIFDKMLIAMVFFARDLPHPFVNSGWSSRQWPCREQAKVCWYTLAIEQRQSKQTADSANTNRQASQSTALCGGRSRDYTCCSNNDNEGSAINVRATISGSITADNSDGFIAEG